MSLGIQCNVYTIHYKPTQYVLVRSKKSQFCFVWTFSCCMNKMRFVLKTNHDIARCDKTFFLWPMNQMGTTYTRRTRVVRKFFAIDLLLNKITHFRDVVENSAICLIPVTLLFIGVYFSLMRSIYCFLDHLSWNTSSLKSQWSCSLKGFTSSIHLSSFFIGALFLIVYKGF